MLTPDHALINGCQDAGPQSVTACHHIIMTDCNETRDPESVSQGETEMAEIEASQGSKPEDREGVTDNEKQEDKEDSSLDGSFVVMEGESIEQKEGSDNKPEIALEYKEETISVDDTGTKEDQAVELNEENIETYSISYNNEEEKSKKSDDIMITDDERSMMVNMFKHFDSDSTGAMSIAELGNFMRAIGTV